MKPVIGLGFIVGIVQTILHILGWLALILGVIALIFGNSTRGLELIVSGVIFIVLKLIIGFIFIGSISLGLGVNAIREKSQKNSVSENNIYNQLVKTLNQIKHGNAPVAQKKSISLHLIKGSSLSSSEKHDLLEQTEKVYNASK